jgi:hypothetical protein
MQLRFLNMASVCSHAVRILHVSQYWHQQLYRTDWQDPGCGIALLIEITCQNGLSDVQMVDPPESL